VKRYEEDERYPIIEQWINDHVRDSVHTNAELTVSFLDLLDDMSENGVLGG
jgi:hypothetical protein